MSSETILGFLFFLVIYSLIIFLIFLFEFSNHFPASLASPHASNHFVIAGKFWEVMICDAALKRLQSVFMQCALASLEECTLTSAAHPCLTTHFAVSAIECS